MIFVYTQFLVGFFKALKGGKTGPKRVFEWVTFIIEFPTGVWGGVGGPEALLVKDYKKPFLTPR